MQLSTTVLSALAFSIATIDAFPIPLQSEQLSYKPYTQEALDQFNVLRFLSTSSPYIQNPGYGISKDTPFQCKVTQANLLSRHGERIPSEDKLEKITKHLADIKNSSEEIKGPLNFLKYYDFEGLDLSKADDETAKGPYSGLLDLYTHGALFREVYDDIFNEKEGVKFFSSNGSRIVASAKSFAQGFLGEDYNESYIIQIEEDNEKLGANSLTPINYCKNYDWENGEDKIDSVSDDYLKDIAERLNTESPGLNISKKAVKSLMDYCGIDLIVTGSSEICDIFKSDEFLAYSYSNDVKVYFEQGPGNNLSSSVGAVYVNGLIKSLKDKNANLTLSFTHSSSMFPIISALGLYDGEIPTDYQDFDHPWKVSNIMPMGARLVFERLECDGEDEPFVRIIHNDAVLPLKGHSTGPGFSTPLSDFEDYYNDRFEGKDYVKDCGLDEGTPDELTFFWDN
ncbi:Repressible acid phosphatase [Wickerhamomyces ciferrii]|uniref:acid phosphatase n=1 Tax=Wickerhamomyces ciferrii (strain ATCC 14091 / BCRC 22168 / CBS 111 / JCM 3599 / NBRC 0793 / NRRL Y-1031 F-60-10) TaxID=1206466 RepID=K0L0D7_WICCF|nr:Repressible acid phosphatase [Wickerhamomyces ciferrii]CCH47054.1 Repressible acid phosphatase [Wickerhamomyces ciferrii]